MHLKCSLFQLKFSLILNQKDLLYATQPIHNIIFELYMYYMYMSTFCVYIVFYGIEIMFVESVMQIVFLFMQQTALLGLNTASLVLNVPNPTYIRCSSTQYLLENIIIVYTQPRKMVMGTIFQTETS